LSFAEVDFDSFDFVLYDYEMNRHLLHGTVEVPLPPEEALALFTPAGERSWVPGWDPQFASGEDTSPGTTFTTHDGHTFWVIADHSPDTMRYARVTPGVHAGTVEVRCEPAGTATRAHVTYDLTGHGVDEFADEFPAMLAEWERLIAASLA
jgi:Polyketide cyclase / dehydrase and lipid transport